MKGIKTIFYKKTLPLIKEDLLITIERFYGANLGAIAIFGSIARGDFTENSDIDLMIVIKKSQESFKKRIESFYSVIGYYFDDHFLSPIIITEEESERFHSFYLGVFDNHIVLYDPYQILHRMKKGLEDRKSTGKILEIQDGIKYWRIMDA